jgi:hypothetical protein
MSKTSLNSKLLGENDPMGHPHIMKGHMGDHNSGIERFYRARLSIKKRYDDVNCMYGPPEDFQKYGY